MRYFIHIITNKERLVDPDGSEFADLEAARAEVSQSARDLMAEELRGGRSVPFGWQVQVADGARRWIVEKTCGDRTYGARPLRRALQKYVEDPLSEALISGRFSETSVIEVYLDGDALGYRAVELEELGDALLVR